MCVHTVPEHTAKMRECLQQLKAAVYKPSTGCWPFLPSRRGSQSTSISDNSGTKYCVIMLGNMCASSKLRITSTVYSIRRHLFQTKRSCVLFWELSSSSDSLSYFIPDEWILLLLATKASLLYLLNTQCNCCITPWCTTEPELSEDGPFNFFLLFTTSQYFTCFEFSVPQ